MQSPLSPQNINVGKFKTFKRSRKVKPFKPGNILVAFLCTDSTELSILTFGVRIPHSVVVYSSFGNRLLKF